MSICQEFSYFPYFGVLPRSRAQSLRATRGEEFDAAFRRASKSDGAEGLVRDARAQFSGIMPTIHG